MPISAEEFEAIDEDTDGPTPGTNAARILTFLRGHPDKAFRQSEIAAATDVARGSVGPTLVRLRERGRVDHRGPFWRVSDHEESVDAGTGLSSETLASREGDDEIPAMEDWDSRAVDPRTQRDDG